MRKVLASNEGADNSHFGRFFFHISLVIETWGVARPKKFFADAYAHTRWSIVDNFPTR
jgi:hypothetical protein